MKRRTIKMMDKNEIMEHLCWLIEKDMKDLNLKRNTNKLDYYFILNNTEYNVIITINKKETRYKPKMRWHEQMDTDKFNTIWDYCYEPIDISLEKTGEDKYTLDIDKLSETCDSYCKDWDKLKEMELDWFTGQHMLWFCLEYLSLDNEPDITVTDPEKAYDIHKKLEEKLTLGDKTK